MRLLGCLPVRRLPFVILLSLSSYAVFGQNAEQQRQPYRDPTREFAKVVQLHQKEDDRLTVRMPLPATPKPD